MPVYIQSRVPPRQPGAQYPLDGRRPCPVGKKINVTSAQGIAHPNRIAFSPMTGVPGRYHGFYCFENFWQSGKRFRELNHPDQHVKDADIKRWKGYDQPKRRHPKAPKGSVPVDAVYPDIFPGESFDYIESRKRVYVPLYHKYITERSESKELLAMWKEAVAKGASVIITDFDGPKEPSNDPDVKYIRPCLRVDLDLLREKINDPMYPFGHGYVVAAAMLGISPEEYIGLPASDMPKATTKVPTDKPKAIPKVKPKVIPAAKVPGSSPGSDSDSDNVGCNGKITIRITKK